MERFFIVVDVSAKDPGLLFEQLVNAVKDGKDRRYELRMYEAKEEGKYSREFPALQYTGKLEPSLRTVGHTFD